MPTPEATQLAEEVFYMDTPEEVAEALDRFAAQRGAEADRENAWLRRLLLWCRPRLKMSAYMATLDGYLAAGPTDPPAEDEPRIVQSAGAPPQTGGGERYRHKKRGTTYQVIGVASSQVVGEPIGEGGKVVVYRAENGPSWDLWVRPYDEFHDGRFEYIGGPQTGGDPEPPLLGALPPESSPWQIGTIVGENNTPEPPQTGGGDAPRYRVEGGEVVDTKTGKREPIIEHHTQTGGGDAPLSPRLVYHETTGAEPEWWTWEGDEKVAVRIVEIT